MTITENTQPRTLVNIIGIPLQIGAIWMGGYYFMGFIGIVIFLAAIELINLAKEKAGNPSFALLFLGLIVIFYTQHLGDPSQVTTILILLVMSVLTAELFRNQSTPLFNISTTIFGYFWLGLMLGAMISIRNMADVGFILTLSMFLSVWACDTFAFIFGSKWGKKKILPSVSPKKSWVGSITGLLGSILVMMFIFQQGYFDTILTQLDVLVLGVIFGGFSQFGDFTESMLKREAGVKDTSDFLQGHGGILDRFDSLSIAAPLAYIYLMMFV